jgi:predicted MPP superfamily phosphohydrolase
VGDVILRVWAGALAGWLPAKTDVDVERHEVTIDMPCAHALRIVFASDFHAGATTPPQLLDAAVQRIVDARPDLLLLGGDYVSFAADDARPLFARLATVRAPLGRYAVLGNHDHDSNGPAVASLLEAAGIEMLTNRNVALPAPYDALTVCGLDDHTRGVPDARAAFAGTGPVRLVLMHAPAGLLDIGRHRFALGLCGHTHGGQVALPNGWPLLTACGPLSRRYSAGRYDLDGGRTLLVSRGVGFTALPIRLNAPPAITICTLQPRPTGTTSASCS